MAAQHVSTSTFDDTVVSEATTLDSGSCDHHSSKDTNQRFFVAPQHEQHTIDGSFQTHLTDVDEDLRGTERTGAATIEVLSIWSDVERWLHACREAEEEENRPADAGTIARAATKRWETGGGVCDEIVFGTAGSDRDQPVLDQGDYDDGDGSLGAGREAGRPSASDRAMQGIANVVL